MTGLRIGHGYDVHRLAAGRKLILGGVEIPWERGLLGHSDADVLLHAVMDALLGAAALPDIGRQFPDSDPRYAGADSRELLRQVAGLLCEQGWQVVNVDATVIAQAPNSPPTSRRWPEISPGTGCGGRAGQCQGYHGGGPCFTGAERGIAAHAVCLIQHNN